MSIRCPALHLLGCCQWRPGAKEQTKRTGIVFSFFCSWVTTPRCLAEETACFSLSGLVSSNRRLQLPPNFFACCQSLQQIALHSRFSRFEALAIPKFRQIDFTWPKSKYSKQDNDFGYTKTIQFPTYLKHPKVQRVQSKKKQKRKT